jgi:hypothetical protein
MLLATTCCCGGCRKASDGSGHGAPDVFVVVIDACSAGYLGCYGDPGGASPNIDRFAKDAVLFENAYSQSASTVPSTASLMTGVRATTHRLSGQSRLSANLKTMAELLAASGYSCSGFFANPYAGAPPLGLDRGYAHAVQAYALPELQEGRPIEESSGFRVVWPEDLDRRIARRLGTSRTSSRRLTCCRRFSTTSASSGRSTSRERASSPSSAARRTGSGSPTS